MKKIIPIFLLLLFFFTSCEREEENDYFLAISKELTLDVKKDPVKMKEIFTRELQKYQETGNTKFLISSKQVEMVIYENDKLKQIPLCYDLMKINDDRYAFITIDCNSNLAAYFEKSAPDWAMRYINIAINISEETTKKYSLGHLYHFKGRILYNDGEYEKALKLFTKALEIFEKENETLYVASMHNNYGLCYDKMNQPKRAIAETEKAIKMLNDKPNLRNVEKLFLNYMKEGLAGYYKKEGNYEKAETLLQSELAFSLQNKNYGMVVTTSRSLMSIYDSILINPAGTKSIISSLKAIEPKMIINENKIILNTILQDYYLKTNDIQSLKTVTRKLIDLNNEHDQNYKQEIETKLNFADQYLIKSVTQEWAYEKKKNIFLLIGFFILITSFSLIIFLLKKMKERKEAVYIQEKIISKNQKQILEQEVQLQREKINNLRLNLNLKTETEREFLENIKKIKKSKNIDTEELLRNLQLKINNLILIDKRNNQFLDEDSDENKKFIETLSSKYPSLTTQELQLCVYFKLDLTAKEISLLKKFTVGSIRVYKTKIKTKMGLGREDSLNIFLNSLN